MSAKARVVYEALPGSDWIRLLKLLPGKGRFDALEVHQLERAPLFAALSYTWGCPFADPNHELEDANDTAQHNARYTSERDCAIDCGDAQIMLTRNAKDFLDGFLQSNFRNIVYLW